MSLTVISITNGRYRIIKYDHTKTKYIKAVWIFYGIYCQLHPCGKQVNTWDWELDQGGKGALVASMCHGRTGGRLNKKDGLTRYGNSHVKDKTS